MKKIFPLVLSLVSFYLHAAQEPKFEKKAIQDVKNIMKDPESTQFRNLKEIKNTIGKNTICGEVNSKNSYGGYIGFMPFSYSDEGISIINFNDKSYRTNLQIKMYEKSGCDGGKSEILARNPEMTKNYCEIAYQLFEDVVSHSKTRNEAIEIAMSSYQNKGLTIFEKDLVKAKADLLKNLDDISAIPEAVKKIKKKDKLFKKNYSFGCPTLMERSYLQS